MVQTRLLVVDPACEAYHKAGGQTMHGSAIPSSHGQLGEKIQPTRTASTVPRDMRSISVCLVPSRSLCLCLSVFLLSVCLSISRSHLIALPCLFILPCKCSICSGYVHQFSFFITNSSVFLSSSVPAAALFLILCVAS